MLWSVPTSLPPSCNTRILSYLSADTEKEKLDVSDGRCLPFGPQFGACQLSLSEVTPFWNVVVMGLLCFNEQIFHRLILLFWPLSCGPTHILCDVQLQWTGAPTPSPGVQSVAESPDWRQCYWSRLGNSPQTTASWQQEDTFHNLQSSKLCNLFFLWPGNWHLEKDEREKDSVSFEKYNKAVPCLLRTTLSIRFHCLDRQWWTRFPMSSTPSKIALPRRESCSKNTMSEYRNHSRKGPSSRSGDQNSSHHQGQNQPRSTRSDRLVSQTRDFCIACYSSKWQGNCSFGVILQSECRSQRTHWLYHNQRYWRMTRSMWNPAHWCCSPSWRWQWRGCWALHSCRVVSVCHRELEAVGIWLGIRWLRQEPELWCCRTSKRPANKICTWSWTWNNRLVLSWLDATLGKKIAFSQREYIKESWSLLLLPCGFKWNVNKTKRESHRTCSSSLSEFWSLTRISFVSGVVRKKKGLRFNFHSGCVLSVCVFFSPDLRDQFWWRGAVVWSQVWFLCTRRGADKARRFRWLDWGSWSHQMCPSHDVIREVSLLKWANEKQRRIELHAIVLNCWGILWNHTSNFPHGLWLRTLFNFVSPCPSQKVDVWLSSLEACEFVLLKNKLGVLGGKWVSHAIPDCFCWPPKRPFFLRKREKTPNDIFWLRNSRSTWK